MVSKRKPAANNVAGPSKKRAKAQEKPKIKQENPVVQTKKKRKRTKVVKEEPIEKDENIDFTNNIKVEEEEIVEPNIEPPANKTDGLIPNYGLPNWPAEHMSELLRRIEGVLPADDQMAYKSRTDKLNWNEVAFETYSGTDCRLMWDGISKRIRRFRILRELVDDAKEWLSKPWTNFYRGSKNNRHPDLPRRPLSTYMIFYLKKKDKVLQENPGLEMTDLSKHIAEMYKKITPKSKKKYKELATLQRKEYDAKMEEFHRLHPELMPNPSKSAVQQANDRVPKKPLTPFKLFCQDKLKHSEHEPEYDKNTFIEKCKEQWRTMSDKKKVFWINWSSTKESEFHEQLRKYAIENPDYTPATLKSILTKEERTISERMAGKPEKPPNSAYSLFSRVMLASADVKSVNPKERMLLIAQQWKNCTDIEKKEYSDRVKHMLEQYKLQYAAYLENLPEDKRQEELQNNAPKRKRTSSKQKPTEETSKKRNVKAAEPKSVKKKVEKTANSKPVVKKSENLYDGEPEPPPATPFLMFVKTYQSSYPDRDDAQDVWNRMSEEQRNFHRSVLWDMKKVYIESYENFLKGLTQEELTQYSQWKKSNKILNQLDSEPTSEESGGSDSEEEVNSDEY